LPGLFALATRQFGLEAISYSLLMNAILLLLLYQWLAMRYKGLEVQKQFR
jgi:hypothetical protein